MNKIDYEDLIVLREIPDEGIDVASLLTRLSDKNLSPLGDILLRLQVSGLIGVNGKPVHSRDWLGLKVNRCETAHPYMRTLERAEDLLESRFRYGKLRRRKVDHEDLLLRMKAHIDEYLSAEHAYTADPNPDDAKDANKEFNRLVDICYEFLKASLFRWAPHKLKDLVKDLHL